MNFIAPEFLYALGFLAIPILIHLFNFRRYKTVQFSQVQFLKSIKQQTQSTSRLKHLVVLICRCLALASLVFAFAQPFFTATDSEVVSGKKGIVIYIDNSFSMQANAEVGSLLDGAKNKALTIVNVYNAADKFQLHTNDFKASEQRWLNRDAFINQLQEVDFSPKFRTFQALSNRLKAVENDDNYFLQNYIISDLQKTSYDLSEVKDSAKFFIIPVQSQLQENIWIKDFRAFQPFHLPGLNEQFNLGIKRNIGNERNQINGKLILNGEIKNPFIVEMENDSATKEINFNNPETNQILGKVALKDYPVAFDDTFYFSYPTNKKIEVLHLYQDINNNSFTTLFSKDSLIDFESSTVKQIDYSKLKTANMVVLENIEELSSGLISELTAFIKSGGTLMCFPSRQMNVASVNSLFNQFGLLGYGKQIVDTAQVNELNIKSSLFSNVFEETPKSINYPTSYQSWLIQNNPNTVSERILAFANGNSFLEKFELNSGTIFLCASNLNEQISNFGKHALFVPNMYNMALQSSRIGQTSYLIDETKITLTAIQSSESPLKMKKGNYEWIPKQVWKENSVEIYLREQIAEPGFYELVQNENVIETLAFNYNRNESDLSQFTVNQFEEHAATNDLLIEVIDGNLDSLSASINNMDKAQTLWKYYILLSLFFIGLEILFLRILK